MATSTTQQTKIPPPSAAILQHRITLGHTFKSGGQRGSLTKCVQRLGDYQSKDDKPFMKRALINEIKLYQLESTKQFMQYKQQLNLSPETHEKQAKSTTENTTMEELEKEVEAAKGQAEISQQRQSCSIEYDAVAKLALDQTKTRGVLENEVKSMHEDLHRMEAETKRLDTVLAKRERQFHLLMKLMTDMKKSVEEENAEEANERESQEEQESERKKQKLQEDHGDDHDAAATATTTTSGCCRIVLFFGEFHVSVGVKNIAKTSNQLTAKQCSWRRSRVCQECSRSLQHISDLEQKAFMRGNGVHPSCCHAWN
mmetsp:Transcript_12073/g.34949  ORF Transcript_12073/g.34949 Transcript_12073/m.34949 type:complete len:313 (+) Transcript_12073:80-1018(+)